MAFEVTIPTAILPAQPGITVTGPMAEQDVPLDREPTTKKKKVARKPDRAYSGIPLMVSNGRSPQPIKGLPVQKAWPGEGTGVSYKGPFVPDDGVSTETNTADDKDMPVFSLPTNRLQVIPGEDTFLSKMLRPDEDELEAARNGMRWHWALEHRFMPPGSKWNTTVWQGADRENQWLSQMLKRRGQDLKNITTPIATSRDRATMNNMWKQFLRDVQNGHFDAYGGTTETAQQWADAFKQRYEDKFGEGAAVELAPVADVLGKRTELARKNLQDYRNALNMTENAVENISDWIKHGDFNDPARAQEISVVLDKVGQNITTMLGGDSKGMADAEKIRIQIQYLPKEAKRYVYENIKRYRDSVRSIVQSGLAKQWSQNNYGKMNRTQQAAFNEVENDDTDITDGSFAHVVSTLGDVMTGFLSTNESELPTSLRDALEGVQNIYDTYMNNMVLAANVAPNVLYDFAEYLHRQAKRGYNKEVGVYGRGINEWTGNLEELDRPKLRTLVPPDELMIPPDYPMAKLEAPPRGEASSNPSSSGEQRTRPGTKAQAKAGGKSANGRHGR